MNGLQIYEIAKQAQWEAEYQAALDSIESDYAPAPSRPSILVRLGQQLRRMVGALRVGRSEAAHASD